MKFLLVFTKKSVPEWQQCYYDYASMKSLVVLVKKAYAIRCNIQELEPLPDDP